MLDQIRALYEDYMAEFQQLEENRQLGAGVFGLGNGPRNYPCHERFGRELGLLLKGAGESLPPEEAARVLEYIYFVPQAREGRQDAVYWMLTAVHSMTEELAGRLSPEDAAGLLARYEAAYPRRKRLPAQNKVVTALKKRR